MVNKKSITILGSTGSIGSNLVDLISRNKSSYRVEALTAFRNVDKLAHQALKLGAKFVSIGDVSLYGDLADRLSGSGIELGCGHQGIIEAALRPSEWVMVSIVGAAGLEPSYAALGRGCILALANKETLVCGGKVILERAAKHGSKILPVDSEHSAIFQVLNGDHNSCFEKIILTASGGPFLHHSKEQLLRVSVKEALSHPNWDMGAKISIDSATMMNKGLEIIEACSLFSVSESDIEVVIHPQSIIHSCVSYSDGSMLAQLGEPDMRTPISYALAWPERMPTPVLPLDLSALSSLTFLPLDDERFPAINLARAAYDVGGNAPIIMNAANEIAVKAFLEQEIGFLDIVNVVEKTLESFPHSRVSNISEILQCDKETRIYARQLVSDFDVGKKISAVG